MKPTPHATRGFSLVEVAMALSVAAFCLLTLIALLTIGLHNYQQASSRTTMVDISTAVAQDLTATPAGGSATLPSSSPRFLFKVPASGGNTDMTPQTAFVDGNGSGEAGTGISGGSLYRVSVAFFPPTTGLKTATVARILVTFPAQADPTAGIWPINYSSMFETMVSLNRN